MEWVAAIDVAKASGMVCTRMPHATKTSQRVTTVWQVSSTTTAILESGPRPRCPMPISPATAGWSMPS
jgi:transposase